MKLKDIIDEVEEAGFSLKESMTVIPPWTGIMKVGLFACRSPVRPNPLGLSMVRVKRIIENEEEAVA